MTKKNNKQIDLEDSIKEITNKESTPEKINHKDDPETYGSGAKSELLKIGDTHHRIRMQFDVGYTGSPGKKMDGDSETIPDMSLTVRQLVESHTRGQDSKVQVKKPLYFDLPIPVVQDILDVKRYREKLEEQIQKVNEFIKEEEAEREAAEKGVPGTQKGDSKEDNSLSSEQEKPDNK